MGKPNMREQAQECRTVSVPEAGRALGIGRDASYQAARDGTIRTIKVGRLLRVPKAWLDRILSAGEVA
jgi:excisionase family DNA binding protein